MRRLFYLLQKEFLQIFRNRMMLSMIVLMPVIQLLILPWAATFEQRNINLCVIDNDRSAFSRRLVDKLSASPYFQLVEYTDSYNVAMERVESDAASIVLELPADFEQNLLREKKLNFLLMIDAVNGQKAGVGLSYITQIINQYVVDEAAKMGQKAPQVVVRPQYRYNASLDYHNFMVPAIMVMLITTLTGMLGAQNIVREKEAGTIEQMNVTPISKGTFILGKIIPFWIIGYVVLTFGMIIAWLMFGLVPKGNVVTLYVVAAFFILTYTGLGVIISNIASTMQQAMLLTFFTLMLSILLCGMFTPISSMPDWARTLTIFNPMTYFVSVMRLVYLKGSGFLDVLPQLFTLIAFAVVVNGIAIVSYRKTTN